MITNNINTNNQQNTGQVFDLIKVIEIQNNLLYSYRAIKILLNEYCLAYNNLNLDLYESKIIKFKKENVQKFVTLIESLPDNSKILRRSKEQIIEKIKSCQYKICDLLNLKIYGGDEENNKLVYAINNSFLDHIIQLTNNINEIAYLYPEDVQFTSVNHNLIATEISKFSLKTYQVEDLNTPYEMQVNINNNIKIVRQELQRFQQMNNKLINFSHK